MGLLLQRGRARWVSRHGENWTAALPGLADAARGLDTDSVEAFAQLEAGCLRDILMIDGYRQGSLNIPTQIPGNRIGQSREEYVAASIDARNLCAGRRNHDDQSLFRDTLGGEFDSGRPSIK